MQRTIAPVRTFGISAPLATHFREATCDEVGCGAYRNGWITRVLEGDLGLCDKQALYIRQHSGRRFTEHRADDGFTVFTFEAGQRCFRAHRRRIDRPERFYIVDGRPSGILAPESAPSMTADEWVDRFAHHTADLAARLG